MFEIVINFALFCFLVPLAIILAFIVGVVLLAAVVWVMDRIM